MRKLNLLVLILAAFALQTAAQSTKSIISYNILYGMRSDSTAGKAQFAEWVRKQNPDILALQETNFFTQPMLEELAHSYGHTYAALNNRACTDFLTSITSKTPIVNVDKVTDNMWHGFVKCNIDGYNIIVLHLSPFKYKKRRDEIAVILETVRRSGPFEKWLIMGDFNSVSPFDEQHYADGVYEEKLRAAGKKNPERIENLADDKIDYEVQRRILDFGFVDAARQDDSFSYDFRSRIDFIYVSPDLKDKIVQCGFITDEFTKKYSDHRPVLLILKE